MKKKNSVSWLWLLGILSLSLWSAPFVPQVVHRDAKWFLHINLEAFNRTRIMELIREEWKEKSEWRKLEAVKTLLGVDLLQDLFDLTLYGAYPQGPFGYGIILIHGKWDKERILALIRLGDQFEEKGYGSYKLYRMSPNQKFLLDEKDEPKKPDDMKDTKTKKEGGWCCFHEKGYLLIAQTETAMRMALDVIDRKEPSLSLLPYLKDYGVEQGSTPFLVGNIQLGMLTFTNPQTAFLQQAKSLTVVMSHVIIQRNEEDSSGWRLDLWVTSANAQVAEQIRKSLDGLVALIQLNLGSNPQQKELKEIVDQIIIQQEREQIHIFCQLSESLLAQWIRIMGKTKHNSSNPTHLP